jgi:hypothetical protein
MKIDFSEVRNILTHVERLLDAHQGGEIYKGQIGLSRRHDGKSAALSTDLLAIQDCLRLADAEVSTIYWVSQGREDPRRPAAAPWQASGRLTPDTNQRGGTAPGGSVGRIRRVPVRPQSSAVG